MRGGCPAGRQELEAAAAAGAQQLQQATAAEKQVQELQRRRDALRQRLVEIGEEHRAALLPQLEVRPPPGPGHCCRPAVAVSERAPGSCIKRIW